MFNAFADKDENIELPGSDWDYTFSEQNGKTKVNITIYNESLARMEKMIEMGFTEGFKMSMNNLENLLAIYQNDIKRFSCILSTLMIYLWILYNIFMNRKKQLIFPKYQKILEQVGENIRLARKRRKLTTLQVAERAGIDRTTLYHIEKGNSSVSMAAWFNIASCIGAAG